MSLITKANNKRLLILADDNTTDRGRELTGALFNQFNEFHSRQYWDDPEIEKVLVKQHEHEIANMAWFKSENGEPIFSPSSASKCERELTLKTMKAQKDDRKQFPYHTRWTRNATAVHGTTQRDLLYMEKKMAKPSFTVERTDVGLPFWEKASQRLRYFTVDGVRFALAGMTDGLLRYTKDGSLVGFEFKTKSNSVAQVGNYKMKDASPSHKMQCTGYSLLFDTDEYIIMYEALAKDGWFKGEEAKMDIRTFYHKVEQMDKDLLLSKLGRVAKHVKEDTLPPPEWDKCSFCEFKGACGAVAI